MRVELTPQAEVPRVRLVPCGGKYCGYINKYINKFKKEPYPTLWTPAYHPHISMFQGRCRPAAPEQHRGTDQAVARPQDWWKGDHATGWQGPHSPSWFSTARAPDCTGPTRGGGRWCIRLPPGRSTCTADKINFNSQLHLCLSWCHPCERSIFWKLCVSSYVSNHATSSETSPTTPPAHFFQNKQDVILEVKRARGCGCSSVDKLGSG